MKPLQEKGSSQAGYLMRMMNLFKQHIKGLKEAGLNQEITHYSFCTNGSHYAGRKGIKTIGFGPSLENLANTINEYIEIGSIRKKVQKDITAY